MLPAVCVSTMKHLSFLELHKELCNATRLTKMSTPF